MLAPNNNYRSDSMPFPVRVDAGPWFSAGEQLDGPSTYKRLLESRNTERAAHNPFAVYVHVPFCWDICSFCALYTSKAGPDADRRFDEFTDAVLRSLEHNPWSGSEQAPTTVHFGGGTPLSIGVKRLERIVGALIDAFGTSPKCEWALETTTSSLDAETLEALNALRFRRIHVGIQTLDDRTRIRIGRRESGKQAVQRVADLCARGFQTSVDLILGLDGVDDTIVERDVWTLHDAGVRMFSVCELRERNRTAALTKLHDTEWNQRNYGLWQTIWRTMEEAGLIPIHSGQFGRDQADNMYFTHPARGEDCVAVGPYSHGSSGRISYGNYLLPEYYAAVRAGISPIAMGVDYGAAELAVCHLERELLTHRVSLGTIGSVYDAYPSQFPLVLASWFKRGLITETGNDTGIALTVSGSWFVGNMTLELRNMSESNSSFLLPQGRTQEN